VPLIGQLLKLKNKTIEPMKQPHSETEYYLGSDILTMCEVFADRVVRTNKDEYSRRYQTNLEKIKKDIVIGKLAEWGVYFIYLTRGRYLNTPDMQIYPKEHKSFDPDLQWGLYNLHIKAQTYESFARYGDSWIFQAKDPLFEFSNDYDIVIGCRVSVDDLERGALVKIMLEKQFKSVKFGETKLSKFYGNKKAIYLKDNDG
jgi:hypothetical protein